MAQVTQADRIGTTRARLDEVGQGHVLNFIDGLDPEQADRLLDQVDAIDWVELSRLIESHVLRKPGFEFPAQLEPAPWYPYRPTADLEQKYRQARDHGEALIRDGKVAAFTVAGGQGTRLGWEGPKGTYPATPIRKLSLFGCMAEYLIKIESKYGVACPWYILTSTANDAPTRAFFAENDYFGLDERNVVFFTQGMLPAIDAGTGKVLLEAKDSLALSPNGHGGSLKALYTSGAIADMKRRGIEQISYTQIDNPHVKVIDPLFVGLHALDGAQMSSKMLKKAYAKEKLGNICSVDGRVTVIEYSDLPDELAEQTTGDGALRFAAGSIAIHVISVGFVESLNEGADGGFALPPHRAQKKVAFVDPETGERVEPVEANAVKLEMFVFDALPMCKASIVYETDRVEEFAPIKNAEGVDSAESSRGLQIERAARWLESSGVKVARDEQGAVDAVLEIKAATAIEAGDLEGVALPGVIAKGEQRLL